MSITKISDTLIQLMLVLSVWFAENGMAQEGSQDAKEEQAPDVTTPPLSPFWAVPMAPLSLFAPGAGHYFRGEKEIAYRLFRSGGGSILTTLGAALVLGITGAADAVILPMVPITLFGATSWFSLTIADLVGMSLAKSEEKGYPHRFLSNWSTFVRYRRIDDYYFDTSGYYQIGGQLWLGQKVISASVESNPDHSIAIYDIDMGMQIISYSKARQRQGLYGHLELTHEDNQLGFHQQQTITYKLKSILNLAGLSSHLHQMVAVHHLGLQQHFVKYRSPNFAEVDASTGLTGGFDLSWAASKHLKPSLGYLHERDSSISGLTTGFTGVFYAALEANWWRNYYLSLRSYAGSSHVFDFTLETRM